MLALVGRWPFWFSLELQTSTVIYVVGLTLLAAAIVGVAPALKATGRQVQTRLQSLSPGSGSRMQMGRLWTALIVAQVAVTVAILPMAMYLAWSALRLQSGGGYASAEFLNARLSLDRTLEPPTDAGDLAFAARYRGALVEIERRLKDDSRVREVTLSLTSSATSSPWWSKPKHARAHRCRRLQHRRGTNAAPGAIESRRDQLLSAFDVPVTIGRGLIAADASADAAGLTPGVLVSRGLVDQVFSGANPLGRRIKNVGRSREAPSRHVVLNAGMKSLAWCPTFRCADRSTTSRRAVSTTPSPAGTCVPPPQRTRANRRSAALADPLRDLSASSIQTCSRSTSRPPTSRSSRPRA